MRHQIAPSPPKGYPMFSPGREQWQNNIECEECDKKVPVATWTYIMDKQIGRIFVPLCEPCAEAYALAYAVGV